MSQKVSACDAAIDLKLQLLRMARASSTKKFKTTVVPLIQSMPPAVAIRVPGVTCEALASTMLGLPGTRSHSITAVILMLKGFGTAYSSSDGVPDGLTLAIDQLVPDRAFGGITVNALRALDRFIADSYGSTGSPGVHQTETAPNDDSFLTEFQ